MQGFSRFLAVGVSNTALSYGVFMLLLYALGVAWLGQAIGYAAGIAWSFHWNSKWTFERQALDSRDFARFLALQLVLLLVSTLAIALLVDVLNGPATVCWVLVLGVLTVVNFFGQRYWVFGGESARGEG